MRSSGKFGVGLVAGVGEGVPGVQVGEGLGLLVALLTGLRVGVPDMVRVAVFEGLAVRL
jgi:hypothetical protein